MAACDANTPRARSPGHASARRDPAEPAPPTRPDRMRRRSASRPASQRRSAKPSMSLNGRRAMNQNRGERRRGASPTTPAARPSSDGKTGRARDQRRVPASALQIASPRGAAASHSPRRAARPVDSFHQRDVDRVAGRMRLVLRDVELADAEREVDGVDVLQRGREEKRGARQEQERERPRARSARALRRAEPERVVQAAEPIALQIDRDVRVSDRAQLAVDRVGHLRLERARHLVAPDLEPRDRVVVTHAADAEPEVAQHRLGALDRPQLLVGDFAVVRNPRRQARRRRLVPRRQPGAPGQLADLRLGQTRLRRAGCARRTRAPPVGRAGSRRDRPRCCRRR